MKYGRLLYKTVLATVGIATSACGGGCRKKSEAQYGACFKKGSSVCVSAAEGYAEAAEAIGGALASIVGADSVCACGKDGAVTVGLVESEPVSVKAYELLYKLESSSPITESRYLIYAEGGKVALAFEKNEFTSYQPVSFVCEKFISEYLSGKSEVKLDCGVVCSGTMNLIDLQRSVDMLEDEARWEKVHAAIGNDDIYESFRNMFETMFAKEIVPLIGTYYDPATGLFYASASGKKNEGIYPIPEGTSQVLGYIVTTGMHRKLGRKYVIPEICKYKIVYYIKSIQGKDGEFYVAQMPKAKIDSNRIGRDRGACLGLLDRFNEKPTYNVGRLTGDGIDAETYWANLVKEGLAKEEDKPKIYWAESPEERAALDAVKKDASDAPSTAGTTQFQSHEGFVRWLLAKDPYNNPYSAMSNVASASSMIVDWNNKVGAFEGEDTVIEHQDKTFEIKKGDTLNDIMMRWTNSFLNSSGLFGKITNEFDEEGKPVYDGFFGGWGYQNTNGFLKAIGRYSTTKQAYPMPREAIESLLKCINSDEPAVGNILVIFNVWASFNGLRSNILEFYEGDDKEELIKAIYDGLTRPITDPATGKTKAYAAVAIDKCLGKIMKFKKSDGGYGHSVNNGTPGWQGGLRVGVLSDNLSDIDAINCSTALLGNSIADFFGLSITRDIPVYNESDLLIFVNSMLSQKYVIKEGPEGVSAPV